jgi:hypothetical protein
MISIKFIARNTGFVESLSDNETVTMTPIMWKILAKPFSLAFKLPGAQKLSDPMTYPIRSDEKCDRIGSIFQNLLIGSEINRAAKNVIGSKKNRSDRSRYFSSVPFLALQHQVVSDIKINITKKFLLKN